MVTLYVKARCRLNDMHEATRLRLEALRRDKRGVVSFEYVIVAACIVGAVAAAFGPGATGAIEVALKGGITALTTAFTAAL